MANIDLLENEFGEKKIPSTLNVLTILSFIWLGFETIGLLLGLFKKSTSASIKDAPETGSNFLDSIIAFSQEMEKIQLENKLLFSIVSIVCIGLCFYGLLQMRKLYKNGFVLYTIGELLVPVVSMIMLYKPGGTLAILLISFIFPLLFVILYASQRKHLVN
jgi:hypothetical protein